MADLSEHATFVGYQNVLDVYKGISSEYVDHGNQSVMCPSCNALLWKAEVNRPSSTNEEGAFSICYNGKVELPDVRQPDESYLQLFHGESAIKSGSLKRIGEVHPSYTPLQYPLFHPFDEDGYQVNILHKNVSSSSTATRKKVTMREFFAYRIQDRPNTFSTILNGRRLFQQILVDKYTMIEAQRLHFIRGKQHELRCDTYQSLREVKRFLNDTTLNSKDRPDILCRLFKLKLDAMIKLVKDKSLFGRVQEVVYTIEFQKRDLPQAHICVFLHPGSKIHNPKDEDKFISAEIPNKDSDPDLYKLVSDHMIHGPCGDANPKCTCMVNKRCSKNFPKIFNDETAVDSNGFPVYKRRDNSQYVVKSDIMMDNTTVVPYNKTLLKKFQAQVHVEWCNQDGSIKYLFKYINKGPDRATISLVQNKNGDNQDPNLDEIKAFYDCRYVSACEAAWRIFAFDVHYRLPSVMRLAFHLPGEQRVIYGANEDIEDILNKTANASSMFTGGVFFVYGYGGTGKTYLWKILSASIRSKGDVVLNVASSGIASLLLEGGRTVKGNTDVYELLKKTSLIIWDEAPMIHKHAFEALDRTLNDVMNGDSANTSEALFGGKVVVFGGDFRQILPVVTNGTRSECVNACINSSYIWSKCKVLRLTKNMRLTVGCRSSDVENIKEFADWLLDIGQGTVGGPNDGESVIDIPDDLLILNSLDPIGDLIRFVCPDILDRFNEVTYSQDRALLAPLNEVVQEINEHILALFPGDEVQYQSSDSLAESEDVSDDVDPQLYSHDLLNGLKMSGMPNHRLVLKVGVPIMLLRNINHKKGLCNGTRL
ncbi:uncharacterized protein LOC143598819 [Bidens hawaiensis]|uniref:uncharacterized protein LOC143598819 n=1 Tax=Bidens hawaiensis TaxID=980011 RepID=UPI0040494B65